MQVQNKLINESMKEKRILINLNSDDEKTKFKTLLIFRKKIMFAVSSLFFSFAELIGTWHMRTGNKQS